MSEPPTDAPGAARPPEPASPRTWRPSKRHPAAVALAVGAAGAAALVVLAAWDLPPFRGAAETTDNAYVHGRTTVIAPQVSGYVVDVAVGDYQRVRSSQVLARVDDRIYRARVDQARANLDAALAALANSAQAHAARAAALQGQVANLASAEAQLVRARADMERNEDLVRDGSVSVRDRDQNLAAFRSAEAQVLQARAAAEIARQDIRTVDVGRGGLEANVEAARAQLRLAEIDLDHTVIRAPEAGQLGAVGVRLGQYVTNGSQMVSLIPADRWIIADFKETQTHHIRRGDPATFTVDALGGARFSGHVADLSPAAGSEFAVLKPDNATGNFVKVPQRIGVRIHVDPGQSDSGRLSPGMSVEARVETRR